MKIADSTVLVTGANRGRLAQQRRQGAPAPVCYLRRTNARQIKSSAVG
jgi:hypothetical protein